MSDPRAELPPGVKTSPPASDALAPCAHCNAEVDTLRAAAVGIYYDRLCFFCSQSCKSAYEPRPPEVDEGLFQPVPQEQSTSSPPEPTDSKGFSGLGEHFEPAPRLAVATAWSSCVCVLLAGVLWTLGTGWLSISIASSFACACACASIAWSERHQGRAGLLLAGLLLLGMSPWLDLYRSAHVSASVLFTTLAGALVAAARAIYLPYWLPKVADPLAMLEQTPDATFGCKDPPDYKVPVSQAELRAGEEVYLRAGDTTPADVTVTWGQALVVPWPLASHTARVRAGDGLVAGSRLREGEVRGLVRWIGNERAGARLLRTDLQLAPMRWATWTAQYAPAAIVVPCAAAALARNTGAGAALSLIASGVISLAALPVYDLFLQRGRRTAARLLRRGVFLRRSSYLETLSECAAVVLCAEGSITEGRPQVAALRSFSGYSKAEVLSLAAGAFRGASSAAGRSLQAATEAQGLKPHPVRSQEYTAGQGVVAIDTTGVQITVGKRSLLLDHQISCASAEASLLEWEEMGRQVLLVANGAKLVGAVALQDTLHRNSRGAVQQLLDTRVEVILLSSEGQITSSALGRSIGVAHVRAEILPQAQGDEIRRLAQSRRPLVVIGRAARDAAALSAADVGISLDTDGAPLDRWPVEARSSELADAIRAICDAKALRSGCMLVLGGWSGAVFAVLLALLVGAPGYVLPILTSLGTVWGVRQAKLKAHW